MKTSGFKFDIEKISDVVVEQIENLMTDSIIVASDMGTMQDKFTKVTRAKSKYKTESIDICFVWKNIGWDELFNKESYKLEIAEIYNRINFKFSESKKIPTFFRGGQKEAPSFHLPAGLNVWFLTDKQFVKSKIKPLVVMAFGADLQQYLVGKFNTKEDKELFDDMEYYFVEVNDYFSYDKHVDNAWNKE